MNFPLLSHNRSVSPDASNVPVLRFPSGLFGRANELTFLTQILHGSPERGTLFIQGPAGIGKSALLNAFCAEIGKSGRWCARGSFPEHPLPIPYSGFSDALQNLARLLLSEPPHRVRQMRQRLQAELGNNGVLLTSLAPLFEQVIGAQPNVATQVSDNQARLLSALRTTFSVLADLGETPILCIDDIHWADRSSLELLRRLLLESPSPCVYVVATLRSGMAADLTAELTLAEIRRQRRDIVELNLEPIDLSAVTGLLRTTVSEGDAIDIELTAATLHSASQGNPLLLHQLFYTTDPSTGWLRNEQNQKWVWNPVSTSNLPLSEELRQLLDLRLHRCEPDTITLLTVAACRAVELDSGFLSALLDTDIAWTVRSLQQCEAAGILVSLNNDVAAPYRFQFVHSEVRRLLLDRLRETQVRALHRRIGEYLLQTIKPDAQPTTIFSIVGHLTAGLHPTHDSDHAAEIVALLVKAARCALELTAIHTASDYAQNALQWLVALPDGWSTHYTLMLDLYNLTARLALYIGDYKEVVRCSTLLFQMAHTASDKANAYQSCITAATVQGDYNGAIDILHHALAEYGVHIPKKPTTGQLLTLYVRARLLLRGRSDTYLRMLPATTDRLWWEVGDIVASAYMAMQWSGQRTLMAYMSLHGVCWSLQHGHTPLSVMGYTLYSVLLASRFGDAGAGQRFAQLAVDLSERPENHHQRAGVQLTLNMLVFHRTQPISNTIGALRRARKLALEDGDVRLATDCTLAYISHAQLSGAPIGELATDVTKMLAELEPYGETVPLIIGRMLLQNLLNLASESDAPYRLTGSICNEDDVLAQLQQVGNLFGLNAVYNMKATAYLLFGKIKDAMAAADAARIHADALEIGLFTEAIRSQVDALTRLTWYSQAPTSARRQLRRMIAQDIKRLKTWATRSPFNHSHRLHQVEAEYARINGQYADAERHYTAGWSLAASNGFVHDEGGIAELAARHFLRTEQFETAAMWRRRACNAYAQWGSKAKLRYLDQTLPVLAGDAESLSKIHQTDETHTTSATPELRQGWLDAAALLRTMNSYAAPHQIVQELMTTLTERLAVRRVTFLRHEGDQTHLYAEMDENQTAPTFLSNALSDEAIGRIAPMSVIRLAVQQKTTICIDSTEAVALSVRDPYFAGLSSMVLLCAPLMAHGHIIALLLLERQQAPLDHQEVLFSPSEITYIEVVGAHAALLVENSLLRERLVVSASGGGDAAISAWLLGSLRVIYGSRDITPYFQGRLRDLISLLLLQPMDAPITRAEIAAKFWPDTTEGQALTNVRNLLHKLRTALPEAGTLLKITRQQIQWNSTADRWVDVHAFERGVAEASRLSGAAAIHLLRSSVELYRGDLLTGTNDEWVLPIQERLHERLLASLARLVDLLIEDHDYVGAQHYAQLLVSVAPLREEPYRQLIRTYAIAGDTVAARQVYETCVAMLAREFDAPPSPATETIYRHFVGD